MSFYLFFRYPIVNTHTYRNTHTSERDRAAIREVPEKQDTEL